jgi:SAM-dependent methyltransferase
MLGTGILKRAFTFVQEVAMAGVRFAAPPSHVMTEVALSHPDLIKLTRELIIDIPQAQSFDESVTICEARDWRRYFSGKLQGTGIEIGALHRPLPTHSGMRVLYVDRHTADELRQEYAAMHRSHIRKFVAPDIVDDGTKLGTIADGTYEFVIAAHVIEHLTDPIGALANWCRVVRPGGLVFLIVPDKRATFDRRRVRTTIEHLVLDYQRPSKERDYEHFLDYAIHVHRASGNMAIVEADRLRDIDYSIHFHVFQPADLVALVGWFSANVRPIKVLEGPIVDPLAAEFHLLLQVG